MTGEVDKQGLHPSGIMTDMTLAGEVQKLLFPKSSPACSWCCMGVRNQMASVIGGDFFDFIEQSDGCQLLVLGDITGHGLHASLVMSLVYGFLHRASQQNCEPQEVLVDLNRFLRSFAKRSEHFDHFFSATLFFGVINPQSMQLHYVNAGHPAGLVRRRGELLRLPATCHPVGYFDNTDFSPRTFSFEADDRLLLFTDGLIDSSNPAGEMFGEERLERILRETDADHLACLDQLFHEVETFQAGEQPFDDRTAIIVDLHGRQVMSEV